MKKILFFIPALDGGGAERVFIHIMNNLDRERFSVHLALLRKQGAFMSELRTDITVHELRTNLTGAFFKVPPCIVSVRPDIILSTICYMNMVVGFSRLFARRTHALFCARESGMPSVRVKISKSVWNARWLYRTSYRYIDFIVCQSNEMRDDVHECYHVPYSKIITINNPVDVDEIGRRATEEEQAGFIPDRINVLAIGRLNPVKGFDMLLRAMERTTNPRLHLHILGKGELGDGLEQLTADLGIGDRVTFHGFKSNPYPYMRAADVYVLTSWYEGFPNAAVEALSLGCPVLAFACPGGINELIEQGINGLVIPLGDIDALAKELDRGAYLEFDRHRIRERVAHRYNITAILSQYEDLFERGGAVQEQYHEYH